MSERSARPVPAFEARGRLGALPLAVLAVAISLAGCAQRGRPAPELDWRPLAPDDARVRLLRSEMEAQAGGRRAMRARARLAVESPDLRFDRPQRVALAQPDRLRVEVVGLFGQLAAVVASDGRRATVWDAATGRVVERDVHDHLLWELARIELVPAEATALLAGLVPPFDGGGDWSAAQARDGTIRMRRLRSDGASQWLEFDRLGRLARVERRRGERLDWSASFGEFGEGRFPHAISLRFPERDATARVRYDEVEWLEALPDEVFVLQLAR